MNNNNILIINADYVKQNSHIINDVEDTLITQHIFKSQDIDLQYCIGEDLYKEFIDLFETYTYPDDLKILLGDDLYKLYDSYFKPFLKYQTIYYSFFDLYQKSTAKGIVNQTSQNSSTVTEDFFYSQRKDIKNTADFYKTQMKDYLNDNSDLYSNYETDATCTDCNSTFDIYLRKEW